MIFKICVSIRLEVWKKDNIIVIFKCIAECKCVEIDLLWFLIFIDIASNIFFIILVVRLIVNVKIYISYCWFSMLCFQLILEVTNILATTNPLICAIFFVFLSLIYKGLHTLTIRTFVLLEIHNVKFVSKSYRI
jgi:hypothetical protein